MPTEPVGRTPVKEIAISNGGLTRPEIQRGSISLIPRPAVALNQFLNGNPPIRSDINELGRYYVESAIHPLQGFLVHREGTRREEIGDEFIIVGPRLTAEGINAFLYYAAPYKGFGIDTDDIINDWTALYSGTEHYEKLRTAHSTMPGWSMYEQSRELILGILKRDHPNSYSPFQNAHPDDVLIPVIHGRRDANGNITLSTEPLDNELRGLVAEQMPDHVTDPARLDVGMGSIFVAAYSPDNANWPANSGYTATSSRTQPIGPTQVLAFAIRRLVERQAENKMEADDARTKLVPDNQDIQQSWFLRSFTEYLVTGEEPEPSAIAVNPISGSVGSDEPPTLVLDGNQIAAALSVLQQEAAIPEDVPPQSYFLPYGTIFNYKSGGY